jgi:hypothetical protein
MALTTRNTLFPCRFLNYLPVNPLLLACWLNKPSNPRLTPSEEIVCGILTQPKIDSLLLESMFGNSEPQAYLLYLIESVDPFLGLC